MKSQFAQNRAVRWMAQVQQWRESGLGKTRYCRENGLALSTFQYWISKSQPSSDSESASIPALVALPFTFASKAPSIGLMVSNRYAMDIAGQALVRAGIPMLRMPATKVYLAPGVTDMRAGIDRLSMTVQGLLTPSPGIFSSSATASVMLSRFCTGTATAFAFGISVLRNIASAGLSMRPRS